MPAGETTGVRQAFNRHTGCASEACAFGWFLDSHCEFFGPIQVCSSQLLGDLRGLVQLLRLVRVTTLRRLISVLLAAAQCMLPSAATIVCVCMCVVSPLICYVRICVRGERARSHHLSVVDDATGTDNASCDAGCRGLSTSTYTYTLVAITR
jgi:hypothetical protein